MIARDKTAIRRAELSRPLRTALTDGVLAGADAVFDYGCGHGDDVHHLEVAGMKAFGWDPAHRPEGVKNTADVVNLGYVINVVENPQERAAALRQAWEYSARLLIVSARLKSDADMSGFSEFEDGCLTRLQTFQKFYEQQELRDWIQSTLGEVPVAAAPGVFYVFREAERREQFVSSRYRRRIAAPRVRLSDRLFDENQALLQDLIAFVTEHGRLPVVTELDCAANLTSVFGSIPRAFQVVRRVTGPDQWDAIIGERRTDLLVYLALGRFPRRPRISSLPGPLQLDIRAHFGTYKAACVEGDALLFEAGNIDSVDAACRAAEFGKLMPTALYVHVMGVSRLPPILRIYEGCARVLAGSIEGTTVVKLRRQEPKVSYLGYPAFDVEAHPALAFSTRVDLRSLGIRYRDFTGSQNPSILHRKELFVPRDHPGREEFETLSAQEEACGLFDDTSIIGQREGWGRLLQSKGLRIVNHRLLQS